MFMSIHCKKRLARFPFPSRPAGMSITILSLAGNNLIIPGPGCLVSDIPAGDGISLTFFYSVYVSISKGAQA
jgi:hypothetical protein